MTARYLIGDVLEVLPTLEAGSVDLVLTSPPFLALRSYLPADHPDKAKEGGSQPTPGAFIDWLVDVVEALDRVLAPHGSMCIELGDTYSGSGGAGGDYDGEGWRAGQPKFRQVSNGSPSHWSVLEARWLAALVDAEGAIGVQVDKRDTTDRFGPYLTVAMNSPAMVERARAITGVGNIRKNKAGVFVWSVSAQQCRYVLLNIWPHLLIKQEQAKAAIELARRVEESRHGRGSSPSEEEMEIRATIRYFIMNLNEKGGNKGRYPTDWTPPTPHTISHPLVGGPEWAESKSLTLIPELFRMTLVYGFNPLTGRQTRRWRLRNVIRWVRPNPPVGALGDKFRPATSELMVFCRTDEAGRRRFFDLDSVREAPLHGWTSRLTGGETGRLPTKGLNNDRADLGAGNFDTHPAGAPPLDWWNIPLLDGEEPTDVPAKRVTSKAPSGISKGSDAGERQTWRTEGGAPPLDWWEITAAGYSGAHYAVFPEALCVRPIKAMCPEKVCRTCGEPSRRIVGEATYTRNGDEVPGLDPWPWGGNETGRRGDRKSNDGGITREAPTLGWSDCGHDDYRPGLVLDPFAGSGTTLAVAVGHGRDALGIDLDERNARLAEERIGMFLELPDTIT